MKYVFWSTGNPDFDKSNASSESAKMNNRLISKAIYKIRIRGRTWKRREIDRYVHGACYYLSIIH